MISVIIPLFNKRPYIGRALDSVARQTYQSYEVIVVDDGSTDGGSEVVSSQRDARIRLITQANAGPGAARNAGIAEARGSLLAFLDADDEWSPTFLERSRFLLERYPASASVSSAYVRDPPGASSVPAWVGRGLRTGPFRFDHRSSTALAMNVLAMISWVGGTVVRTEVVRNMGGFYERGCTYGEDAFLMLKVLLTRQVTINLESLAIYHVDASGLNQARLRPRAIEPFFEHPEEVYDVCPRELRLALNNLLAARACKTACMLAYWGRWREGRQLIARFAPQPSWELPYFGLAQVSVNPFAAAGAGVWRSVRSFSQA